MIISKLRSHYTVTRKRYYIWILKEGCETSFTENMMVCFQPNYIGVGGNGMIELEKHYLNKRKNRGLLNI